MSIHELEASFSLGPIRFGVSAGKELPRGTEIVSFPVWDMGNVGHEIRVINPHQVFMKKLNTLRWVLLAKLKNQKR